MVPLGTVRMGVQLAQSLPSTKLVAYGCAAGAIARAGVIARAGRLVTVVLSAVKTAVRVASRIARDAVVDAMGLARPAGIVARSNGVGHDGERRAKHSDCDGSRNPHLGLQSVVG